MPASSKITTIKLSQSTKERLERLRSHKRDSYDEILQRVLEILNICKINPQKARVRLIGLDKINKRVGKRSAN